MRQGRVEHRGWRALLFAKHFSRRQAAGYLASGLFDCAPGVAASRSVPNIHLNETGAGHHRDVARDFRQAYFRRGCEDPSDPEGMTANPSDRYKAAVEALAPLGATEESCLRYRACRTSDRQGLPESQRKSVARSGSQIHSRPGASGSSAPGQSRAVPCANSNAPTPCVDEGEHAIHLVQLVEQSLRAFASLRSERCAANRKTFATPKPQTPLDRTTRPAPRRTQHRVSGARRIRTHGADEI
jgi:hypothetical protein